MIGADNVFTSCFDKFWGTGSVSTEPQAGRIIYKRSSQSSELGALDVDTLSIGKQMVTYLQMIF